MRHALATLYLALWAAHAFAQAPATGTLHVTVVDPTSAVIPGAMVTVTGAEDATRNVPVQTVETSDAGIAVVNGLRPGRYSIQAAFPGFDTRTLADVRVRNGDNK